MRTFRFTYRYFRIYIDHSYVGVYMCIYIKYKLGGSVRYRVGGVVRQHLEGM